VARKLKTFDPETAPQADPEPIPSEELLPVTMIETSLGFAGLQKLKKSEGICVVLKAPSADFVEPLCAVMRNMMPWSLRVGRTTRAKDSHDETAVDNFVTALADGGRVLAVSHDPERFLPAAILAAADMTIDIDPVSPRLLTKVIRKMCGGNPEGLTAEMLTGLRFDELIPALRLGSTAAQCVERIQKASARKAASQRDNATGVPPLEDLSGYGLAKQWALQLIEDLGEWRAGGIGFDQIDHNVVLASDPGLGKTSFVRSLALSAGVPLFSTSVGRWFADGPGFLDSVIKQIDNVFASARAAAPSIVFIDELDAIPDRKTLSSRNQDYWTAVVTHLLNTLDGTNSNTENLIIVGATNYIDRIDAALLRPGRLTRVITIEPPDETEIVGILKQHLADDLPREDLTYAASLAAGSTGAEIRQFCKSARRIARLAGRPMIMSDLLTAIAPASPRPEDVERRIAVHECGHAVAALELGFELKSVSVVPRGDEGGRVLVGGLGYRATRQDVERVVLYLLAGRAAEELVLGAPGTGAGGSNTSDLARATEYVAELHLSLGLGNDLRYRADASQTVTLMREPATAAAIEKELREHYATARAMLSARLDGLNRIVEELLQHRHMSGREVQSILDLDQSKSAVTH